MSKASETLADIEHTLAQYRNPALLVSFGKDSLAMLDLLRHLRLPVICYQTPWDRHRWDFANAMAARYGVSLYDYPPDAVALQQGEGMVLELVSAYTIGGKNVLGIRQGIVEDGITGICGLNDCLRRPRGTINFPWDLLLSAQKQGDSDHFGGHHTIAADIRQTPGAADIYFPFRDWTDNEVLAYCAAENVELDDARYGEDGLDNTLRSPDWVHGCFACVRRTSPEAVPCPRLNGATVSNISASTPYLAHDAKL